MRGSLADPVRSLRVRLVGSNCVSLPVHRHRNHGGAVPLGGIFGISLGKHVTQSGFYDDSSQSVKASVLGDDTYGRDRTSHIVATFTAPKTFDDPAWQHKIVNELNEFKKDHPDQVVGWAGWLAAPTSTDPVIKGMANEDGKHTFVSIPLKGDDDDTILTNYKTIEPDLQKLNGGKVQLAGLEPVASALTGTIATDQKRMEVLALPLVAVVLFLVFGGVVAAAPAGDGRRTEHRRSHWDPAIHHHIRARALFRPAGGVHDRSRHRDRLRAVCGESFPRGDRRRVRHRGRGAPHGDDGRTHGDVLGGPDRRVGRPACCCCRRAS